MHSLDESQATGRTEFALERYSIGHDRTRLITDVVGHVAAGERTGTEALFGRGYQVPGSVA